MKRFIVILAVWHDDIRTNHEVVFTQPRPAAAKWRPRLKRFETATGHRITAQLVRLDRPRLMTEARHQVPEEALGGCRVSSLL
jgi:hypothetical protein